MNNGKTARLFEDYQRFYSDKIKSANKHCFDPDRDKYSVMEHENFPKCLKKMVKQNCDGVDWCIDGMLRYIRFDNRCNNIWNLKGFWTDNSYIDCPNEYDDLRKIIQDEDINMDVRNLPRTKFRVTRNYNQRVNDFNASCNNRLSENEIEQLYGMYNCAKALVQSYCKGDERCEFNIKKNSRIRNECIPRNLQEFRYPDFDEFIGPRKKRQVDSKMENLSFDNSTEIDEDENKTDKLSLTPYIEENNEILSKNYSIEEDNTVYSSENNENLRRDINMNNSDDFVFFNNSPVTTKEYLLNNFSMPIKNLEEPARLIESQTTSSLFMNPYVQFGYITGVFMMITLLHCLMRRNSRNSFCVTLFTIMFVFLIIGLGIFGLLNL